MSAPRPARLGRRAFLRLCLAAPAPFVLAACAGGPAAQQPSAVPATAAPAATPAAAAPTATSAPATAVPAPTAAAPTAEPPTAAPTAEPPTAAPTAAASLPLTPECADDDDELTVAQTEGPYFTPNSPERSSLIEAGMAGTRIVVSGLVLSPGCQPVARALLDFWHADDAGEYDNVGYRLRGHIFSDDQGRFSLETIVPGLYPGRTRHFHVKVQAANGPILTTQLYFPGEPGNDSDGIYSPELLMDVQDAPDGSKAGTYTFVIEN
jgi:protocatechuate 3,4-dioxygenase beta subunit